MKRLLILTPLFFALAAFGQTATGPAVASDATAEITLLREGLVDSFNKGDLNRLLTYLDPEVVATWQNGEVTHGSEGVRAYYNKMMSGDARVVREVKLTPEVLGRQVHGDWAVSWGNLHDRFTLMDGSELPFNTLFTIVTAKRGDRWLVTAYHASVNVFDNPVLALAVHKSGFWVGAGAGGLGLLAGWFVARVLGRKRASSA